jgi:hypothetical protein
MSAERRNELAANRGSQLVALFPRFENDPYVCYNTGHKAQ